MKAEAKRHLWQLDKFRLLEQEDQPNPWIKDFILDVIYKSSPELEMPIFFQNLTSVGRKDFSDEDFKSGKIIDERFLHDVANYRSSEVDEARCRAINSILLTNIDFYLTRIDRYRSKDDIIDASKKIMALCLLVNHEFISDKLAEETGRLGALSDHCKKEGCENVFLGALKKSETLKPFKIEVPDYFRHDPHQEHDYKDPENRIKLRRQDILLGFIEYYDGKLPNIAGKNLGSIRNDMKIFEKNINDTERYKDFVNMKATWNTYCQFIQREGREAQKARDALITIRDNLDAMQKDYIDDLGDVTDQSGIDSGSSDLLLKELEKRLSSDKDSSSEVESEKGVNSSKEKSMDGVAIAESFTSQEEGSVAARKSAEVGSTSRVSEMVSKFEKGIASGSKKEEVNVEWRNSILEREGVDFIKFMVLRKVFDIVSDNSLIKTCTDRIVGEPEWQAKAQDFESISMIPQDSDPHIPWVSGFMKKLRGGAPEGTPEYKDQQDVMSRLERIFDDNFSKALLCLEVSKSEVRDLDPLEKCSAVLLVHNNLESLMNCDIIPERFRDPEKLYKLMERKISDLRGVPSASVASVVAKLENGIDGDSLGL